MITLLLDTKAFFLVIIICNLFDSQTCRFYYHPELLNDSFE